MTGLPHEAQLALISFLAALFLGGPVALFGASNLISAVRLAGAIALRHRFATGLGASLLGGAGFFGTGLMRAQETASAGWFGGMVG
jgi:hypothetical protein